MGGFRIGDFDKRIQKIIEDNNIDRNDDGLINADNGELAELLSKSGAKNIKDLTQDYYKDFYIMSGELGLGIFSSMAANKLFKASKKCLKKESIKELAKTISTKVPDDSIKSAINIFRKKSNHLKYLGYLAVGVSVLSLSAFVASAFFTKTGKNIEYVKD